MSETKPATTKPLPTIWNVPDALWETLSKRPTLYDPPPRRGRPRIDQRKALDGILYRLRTGCPWNARPASFGNPIRV